MKCWSHLTKKEAEETAAKFTIFRNPITRKFDRKNYPIELLGNAVVNKVDHDNHTVTYNGSIYVNV